MAASSSSIAVADSIWREIKYSRSASDDHLATLHFLFGKNLERATIIVDQGGVKKVCGEPSGRLIFLVAGESKKKDEYVCFPETFCNCQSFFFDVVNKGEQFYLRMKSVQPLEIFKKIFNNGSMKQGRLLGLDVGQRYVGLAVSDTCNKIASPVSVLVRKKTNIDSMAKDFQTLVSRLSLVGLVVGYPFSLYGQHNLEAVQVRLFIEELRKTGVLDGLIYTYWNENYTSKCVEALLQPLNLHPVEHKTICDKFAAVGILQGYLDYMNRNIESEKQRKKLYTGK